jgi:hypothetical protein
MDWPEKLLFGVIGFQAIALVAWIVFLQREVKEDGGRKRTKTMMTKKLKKH